MQKQTMWASAVLGALWLGLAPVPAAAQPAAAQEGRPAGSQQRDQAAPAAQPQRGEARPAGQDGGQDRAKPAERPVTDRAPQGQPGAERGQGHPTDAAKGLPPAERLEQLEMKHATMTARIQKLMDVYRQKGDKAKLLELEQLRDRAKNKHAKALAELERELGAERYRAARQTFAERHGSAVPTDRGREIREERAKTDAATDRAEQARKEQARKQQAGQGPTDQAKDKPARPPADRPAGKPADKPADKPARGERDGGAS
jgi:hypothetical protein